MHGNLIKNERGLLLNVLHLGVNGSLEEPLLEGGLGHSGLNGAIETLKNARHGHKEGWSQRQNVI